MLLITYITHGAHRRPLTRMPRLRVYGRQSQRCHPRNSDGSAGQAAGRDAFKASLVGVERPPPRPPEKLRRHGEA